MHIHKISNEVLLIGPEKGLKTSNLMWLFTILGITWGLILWGAWLTEIKEISCQQSNKSCQFIRENYFRKTSETLTLNNIQLTIIKEPDSDGESQFGLIINGINFFWSYEKDEVEAFKEEFESFVKMKKESEFAYSYGEKFTTYQLVLYSGIAFGVCLLIAIFCSISNVKTFILDNARQLIYIKIPGLMQSEIFSRTKKFPLAALDNIWIVQNSYTGENTPDYSYSIYFRIKGLSYLIATYEEKYEAQKYVDMLQNHIQT